MVFNGILQFPSVANHYGRFHLFRDHFEMPFHDARGIHKRRVQKTDLDVRDVHGQHVHGVLARVHSRVGRRHPQHVCERERERVAGAHRVKRGGIRGGPGREHVGRDQMVHGDSPDRRPVIVWYAGGARVPVDVVEIWPVVQPERQAQQHETLDEQAQDTVQLDGETVDGGGGWRVVCATGDWQARTREQQQGDRVLDVRQVQHPAPAGAPGHP